MRIEAKKTQRMQAEDKLQELLYCGNERIELSAAKEILSLPSEADKTEDEAVRLEVKIRVVEE